LRNGQDEEEETVPMTAESAQALMAQTGGKLENL
jgi:hypothetical protein